jgi:hypothetical protein
MRILEMGRCGMAVLAGHRTRVGVTIAGDVTR